MSKIQDAELGWRCESDYYVSLANTVLSTHGYGANELKKKYTGGAIGIEVKARTSNNQTWYGPMIISTIESYAKYTPEETVTSVSIGGTTWYVSNPSYWGQDQFDSNHLLPLVDLIDAGIDQAIIDDLNIAASLKAVATKIIELAELEILPILSSTGYVNKFVKRALTKNNEHIVTLIPELTYDQAPTENSNNLVNSGGVYTAIHNLVIPPDIYSTTEIKTNKMWIDGKPIYRKCFTGPEFELSGSGWGTVTWANVDGLNIDKIVYSCVRGRDSDPVFPNLSYPVGISTSQNDTYLHIVPIFNRIFYDTVVIEYTKTTDQPYSGNSLYYRSGYFGIAVPKTISDTVHFQYAEFSTDDYSATTAFAAMMVDAAEHFTFDSISTPSTRETSLTYGNATARTYEYDSTYNSIELIGSRDYFNLRASTPWAAKYIINSKSIMLSAPRADNNGSYIEYTAFAFGKMANDVKAGVWSSYYSGNFRQAYSWGMTPNSYEDIRPIAGSTSNDIGLVQSPINGIYQVIYGDGYLEGFYQVDGAIFYIAAGYAIKDE